EKWYHFDLKERARDSCTGCFVSGVVLANPEVQGAGSLTGCSREAPTWSEHPDPAISSDLRAWLFSTIAESIPKALATFHEQASTDANPPAHIPSDSEDSHPSDHKGAPRKEKIAPLQDNMDPLEDSTSRLAGHVLEDYGVSGFCHLRVC
ncbi:Hypothetical predicted protein, partial [Pelobates cultripes]